MDSIFLLFGKENLPVIGLQVFLKGGLEGVKRRKLRQIVLEVGDAAADGRDSLAVELAAIDVKGIGKRLYVDVIHQRTVNELAVLEDAAGETRNLVAVNKDVVAPALLGRHSELTQRINYHPDGICTVFGGRRGQRAEYGIVQVLQIVVHGAAASCATGQNYAL